MNFLVPLKTTVLTKLESQNHYFIHEEKSMCHRDRVDFYKNLCDRNEKNIIP